MTLNDGFDRRTMLQSMALLLGATMIPAEALALQNAALPRLLGAPRFAVLAAYADTVIPVTSTPGALAAQVPEKIDAMLRDWATPARRDLLIAAIDTLEARAQSAHAAGFTAVTNDQRLALITAYEPEALRAIPRTDGLTGLSAMMAGPNLVDPGYGKLKELVVVTYYLSEIGMTQELDYEHVPGGYTPSIPLTPDTRPQPSGGVF